MAHRNPESIGIPSDLIEKALDNAEGYLQWLRVAALRLLCSNVGWKAVIKAGSLNSSEWLSLAGVTQIESLIKAEGEFHARLTVCSLRDQGISSVLNLPVFPHALTQKLDQLATIVDLTPDEKAILGLAVLFHVEPLLIHLEETLGHDLLIHSVHRIFAAILNRGEHVIKRLMSDGSRLASSGLLTLDHTMGEACLSSHIDFISRSFANRMLNDDNSIMDVFGSMVRSSPPCSLSELDYLHIKEQVDVAYHCLKAWHNGSAKAPTILLWGDPGVGKTNLARLLAEKAGLHATEIPESNENHSPVLPSKRARACRFAQALLQNSPEVLILDECEEVILAQLSDPSETVSKSWLNQFLENQNAPPTIFIANHIASFDPATLRRFDLCVHVPIPPREHRLNILEETSEGRLSVLAMKTIADQAALSPAVLVKANRIARESVAASNNSLDGEKTILLILNQHQAAMGAPPIRVPEDNGLTNEFDPRLTRTNHDLEALKQGLMETRSARILNSGVPGSGKSSMAKWLADAIGLPLMSLKGSDLLDKYVGGSEARTVQAFERAHRDGAILQIDEIDSYLMDRSTAGGRHYQVTLTNAFLTALDDFEGIFIATTNHPKTLDVACQRRFDIHIQFEYPSHETIRELYSCIANNLALRSPCEEDLVHLDSIQNLTPGDFAAVNRKSRLIPIKGHAELLVHLKQISDWKPNTARRIGF
jgi:transitional endoplasmic reticulum ATPase